MKFVKKSSKTTRSNPWTRSTASSKRRLSTSSAIPRSSNPSHPSPISPSHCDMELVLNHQNNTSQSDEQPTLPRYVHRRPHRCPAPAVDNIVSEVTSQARIG